MISKGPFQLPDPLMRYRKSLWRGKAGQEAAHLKQTSLGCLCHPCLSQAIMIITKVVVIIPWIGNEPGHSIGWQTPPWQLAVFGALPISGWRKHSPGSSRPTPAPTAPLSWAKSPSLCCWVPLQAEARWHVSSSWCMACWSRGLCPISVGFQDVLSLQCVSRKGRNWREKREKGYCHPQKSQKLEHLGQLTWNDTYQKIKEVNTKKKRFFFTWGGIQVLTFP